MNNYEFSVIFYGNGFFLYESRVPLKQLTTVTLI